MFKYEWLQFCPLILEINVFKIGISTSIGFKCPPTPSYDEWGLKSTILTILLKATPLFKFINCGGLSNPHESILTNETPFIHRFCCAFVIFNSVFIPLIDCQFEKLFDVSKK